MSATTQLYLFAAIGLIIAFGVALVATALATGRDALSRPRIRLVGIIGAIGIVVFMIIASNVFPAFSPLWILILASITFGLILRHIGQGQS